MMEFRKSFDDDYVSFRVEVNGREVEISGILKNPAAYKRKVITAPNPPDRRNSYSGTALPFPCETIAFENTINYKEIDSGVINTKFIYPNSYYAPNGIDKIKSPIMIIIDDKKIVYELEDACPLKTLRDRVRGNPSFYALKEVLLPVATAENNMYNYSIAKSRFNIA